MEYTEYLTIRLKGLRGNSPRGEAESMALEGERSNCFSITQLDGQKKVIINSAKKYIYIFGNKMK